jgi:hypothetical protein
MRPALIIATALSGVVVAVGFIMLMRNSGVVKAPSEPESTATGRPPAFYLDATPEERRQILHATFPRIASDPAGRLGALKDDVALLLDDPENVRWILGQWHAFGRDDRYAAGAFADIFRLVKNPAFVEPTAALLDSPRSEIRFKALQAAQTQASPALGPRILGLFRNVGPGPPERTSMFKIEAFSAAYACRGDSWPALLDEAVRDPDVEIAVRALTVATDLDVEGLEARAKSAMQQDKTGRVRIHAAALLMRRGDLSAVDEILRALDPQNPALAAEALRLVAKHRIAAAVPRLRELRPKTTGELHRLFTLAMVRAGDSEVMGELLHAVDSAEGQEELDALQILAATGDENVAPVLLHALGRGGSARARSIAVGISSAGKTPSLALLEKLVETPIGHPAELEEAPKAGGKALIPKLASLLRAATDPSAQARYMAWLAMIGGTEARDVILRERDRVKRLADEQLRLIDLEARKLGQEAPPLPR